MALYSVVVPVYNGEHMLEELYQRLAVVFDETIFQPFELIMVDDGSKERSYEVMQRLREADSRVKIIQMARNFGQHCAVLCGFRYAKGDFVITMDDDLQHPPEEIPKLIQAMDEHDDIDVVIASYQGRKHNIVRRTGTAVAAFATAKMLHTDPNIDFTSFRLIRKFIVDAVLQTNTHLPQIGNLLAQTSNRIMNVPIRHQARAYGKSGYSFFSLAKSLFYDITTHSAFPLLVVRDIGIVSFLICVVLALYYFINFLTSDAPVEGFTTLVLLLVGFCSLILLSIGIIGSYLMNILDEAKKLPHYVTRRVETEDACVTVTDGKL